MEWFTESPRKISFHGRCWDNLRCGRSLERHCPGPRAFHSHHFQGTAEPRRYRRGDPRACSQAHEGAELSAESCGQGAGNGAQPFNGSGGAGSGTPLLCAGSQGRLESAPRQRIRPGDCIFRGRRRSRETRDPTDAGAATGCSDHRFHAVKHRQLSVDRRAPQSIRFDRPEIHWTGCSLCWARTTSRWAGWPPNT